MLRTTRWLALPVFLGLLSGCGHLYDCLDEHLVYVKCCHDSKVAWHHVKDLYSGVCHPFHFGSGFRAGYMSVCMGGNGCPPALPPRKYWTVCYQCAEGRAKIVAWYDGFHHGALAAECDGCAGQSHLLTAFELYGCEIPPGAEHHIDMEGLSPTEQPTMPAPLYPDVPDLPSEPREAPPVPEFPNEVNSDSYPVPSLPSYRAELFGGSGPARR